MNRKILYLLIPFTLVIVLIIAFTLNNQVPSQNEKLSISQVFPNLTFNQPVDFQTDNTNDNLIYIVEQPGIIKYFNNLNEITNDTTFLDIRSKVLSGGERGLLGLAFHPNYDQNGLFYVDYTAQPDGRTIVAEFRVTNNKVDMQSERIIFEQYQPYSNHNGGQILFGLDSYLYITLGDGGSAGDPQNNAPNLNTFLGSVLRIDIDHQANKLNYSIPLDNPFVNNTKGYKNEIFAYGLRNPWRLSQDTVTGMLWAGDVGQNAHEEIDVIEKGGNYGWPVMEGFSCYKPSLNCNKTGLALPIIDYGRNDGFAVTGGYVYRGSIQSLYGEYIFADYGTGRIWKISPTNNTSLLFDSGFLISSFGLDNNNELYFFDYGVGKIYTINYFNATNFILNSNLPNFLAQHYAEVVELLIIKKLF